MRFGANKADNWEVASPTTPASSVVTPQGTPEDYRVAGPITHRHTGSPTQGIVNPDHKTKEDNFTGISWDLLLEVGTTTAL